jgi:hypothetical protein
MSPRSLKSSISAVVGSPRHRTAKIRGFVLVTTLMLMVLLTLLAVGLCSASRRFPCAAVRRANALAEAQANARLALMIALGELQKEMGPDMRVSAKAAIFDENPDTENRGIGTISALARQLRVLGRLAQCGILQHPKAGRLSITDTYTPSAKKCSAAGCFPCRRAWKKTPMPKSLSHGWDEGNSVVLVGKGSLGTAAVGTHLETRAYLTNVGQTGSSAWWIGPENHKARIDKANKPRSLSPDSGKPPRATPPRSVWGRCTGLGILDDDATLGDKLISTQPSLPPGQRMPSCKGTSSISPHRVAACWPACAPDTSRKTSACFSRNPSRPARSLPLRCR